jgi:competence protein ComEC
LEKLLELERAQLPPWLVVGFGSGVAAWFALAAPAHWGAFLCAAAACALLGFALIAGRTGWSLGWFSIAAALGCALVWVRAEAVEAPRLLKPAVVEFSGRVESVDHLAAKRSIRLLLAPEPSSLPPRVRVTVDQDNVSTPIAPGAIVHLRTRLAPPPQMALPGTYDFARDAWFKQIGAVGKAIGPVTVTTRVEAQGLQRTRDRLRGQIARNLSERQAGIAIALATGDQNAVVVEDAEAMRRSGLTHLLSVSGLHIAAVVAAAMLLSLRLLALSEFLALRLNLVLVSAAFAAAAGVGYTLLTGAQVPTVRSCVAALLVLGGIALGRDAISIRLIAVGALLILMFRPESLAGASFQMSFAAVTAIVALHSTRFSARMFERREEGIAARLGRALLGMVATGLAVEVALIPLALFHFHKAGLYGVGANIVAIPLTTFVIMPLEVAALVLSGTPLGAPLWALCGLAIDALIGMAHAVASAKGAVAMAPSMPGWAFALMVGGGLWLCLWNSRIRLLGVVPIVVGAIGALAAPAPDLLVSGDGRHLAVVDADGTPYILRERTGEYMQSLLSEASGFDGVPLLLASRPYAACSRDSCVALVGAAGAQRRLLATRSATRLDWTALTAACSDADIVVSDRRLPRGCMPRWLRLDRASLERTGGVAVYLDRGRVDTVGERVGAHPWAM